MDRKYDVQYLSDQTHNRYSVNDLYEEVSFKLEIQSPKYLPNSKHTVYNR